MNRFVLALLAASNLAAWTPAVAQTAQKAEKSLVPQGMIADRNALTAMDYIEIQQLYARYAASLDLGDGAARATTFTPEGYYANLPSGHKPVPVAELARRTTATGNVGDRHLVTNLIITPTKEGADGFAYLVYISPDGKPHTGFYVDKIVKTPEGWRFVGRHGWYDIDPASPYRPKNMAKPAAPQGDDKPQQK